MKQQSSTGMYSLPYTVRPEKAVFGLVFILGMIISFFLLLVIQRGPSTVLPVVLLLCMIWGYIIAWILSIGLQRIVLLPDRVCYRKLFSTKEVLFADITNVMLEQVRVRGYRGYGVIRYFLRIDARSSEKPLLINTKPFSKKDLSIVIDVITTHAPSAHLDTSLLQLREDAF